MTILMGVVSSKVTVSPIHWPRRLAEWFDEYGNDVNHMLLPLRSPHLNPVEHLRQSSEMNLFLSFLNQNSSFKSSRSSCIGMVRKHDVPKRVHRRQTDIVLHIYAGSIFYAEPSSNSAFILTWATQLESCHWWFRCHHNYKMCPQIDIPWQSTHKPVVAGKNGMQRW